MKKIILFVSLCFISASCTNDEETKVETTSDEKLITKVNFSLLINTFSFPKENYLETYEYDEQKRLVRKNGGFIPMSGASGYAFYPTDILYKQITYLDNKVIVENFVDKTKDEFSATLRAPQFFYLNSKSQIEYVEIPNKDNEDGSYPYFDKKEIYTYTNNKISERKITYPYMPSDHPEDYILTYVEKYFYDSNENLIRTEFYEQHNGINEGYSAIQTFENYDNSYNPFSKFIYLDEYFYRSLSKNNFRKYTKTEYKDGEISGKTELIWDPTYDAKGNIILYIEK